MIIRTADIFINGFEDIRVLLQYLYMDEDHYIIVDNGLCKLRIHMIVNEDSMCLVQKNMNYPEFEETPREIFIHELLAMVEQLKEQEPSDENKDVSLHSRWEEIQYVVASSITLTQMNKERAWQIVKGSNDKTICTL